MEKDFSGKSAVSENIINKSKSIKDENKYKTVETIGDNDLQKQNKQDSLLHIMTNKEEVSEECIPLVKRKDEEIAIQRCHLESETNFSQSRGISNLENEKCNADAKNAYNTNSLRNMDLNKKEIYVEPKNPDKNCCTDETIETGNEHSSNLCVPQNTRNTEHNYENYENPCEENAFFSSNAVTTKFTDDALDDINSSRRHTFPSESFSEDTEQKISTGNESKKKISSRFQFKVEDMDPDTVCGIWGFKPQWLQPWATAKTYLVLYSIIGILQGTFYTYFIGSMTTLEKRYAFKSQISGLVMMIDEIVPLFFGVLIGYFGGRAHRPRIVALGMFMSAMCCFVSALPYFIYGPSTHLVASSVKNNTGTEYCDRELKAEICEEDDRPPTFAAVACLLLGSFFKGFGNLAYYSVGMAYLDDSTKKKNTPIFFGLTIAFRILGPSIGFLTCSAFLKFYENPLKDPGFGPEDPRWIGAWWLGFVLQGILLLIFTCPILLFPRRLPKQRQRCLSNTENFAQENFGQRIYGMVRATKRLVKNPFYILFTFGTILSITGGFGWYIMLPKYVETQFHLSSSDASLFSGPPELVAVQVFTVIGGIAIWKWRPSAKTLIAGQIFTEVAAVLGTLALMFPSCQNVMMGEHTSKGFELGNECNVDCLCSTNVFNPVCGPDGITSYFSPCHAGCPATSNSSFEIIANCSCIHSDDGSQTITGPVKKGRCQSESCWPQAVMYLAALPILAAITNIFRVGHTMILLRCVNPSDRSIALGMFQTLLCALAFIPQPVIYGSLVDAACLVWEKSCGKTGNCWFYDVEKFKYLLHGVSACFMCLSAICYTAIFFMPHHVHDLYEDDVDEHIKISVKEEKTIESQEENRDS